MSIQIEYAYKKRMGGIPCKQSRLHVNIFVLDKGTENFQNSYLEARKKGISCTNCSLFTFMHFDCLLRLQTNLYWEGMCKLLPYTFVDYLSRACVQFGHDYLQSKIILIKTVSWLMWIYCNELIIFFLVMSI